MGAMGLILLIGLIGAACTCRGTQSKDVQLWEKTCYECQKCKDDKIQIVAVTYGDKVVSSEFRQLYNEGQRVFAAGDETWGSTWTDVTKTLVFTYRLCGQYITKVIEEG